MTDFKPCNADSRGKICSTTRSPFHDSSTPNAGSESSTSSENREDFPEDVRQDDMRNIYLTSTNIFCPCLIRFLGEVLLRATHGAFLNNTAGKVGESMKRSHLDCERNERNDIKNLRMLLFSKTFE